MKKTLFLAALTGMLVAPAFATNIHVYTTATEGGVVGTTTTPYDLAFTDPNNDPRVVTMENGTAITSTGANMPNGQIQMGGLTLVQGATAEIKVTSNHNFGLLGSHHNKVSMTLNGGTLNKTGNGQMMIVNTEADTGTLNLTNGSILVDEKGDYGLKGDTLTMNLSSGTSMTVKKNSNVNSLTGTGATLTVNSNASLTINDTLTFRGNSALNVTAGSTLTGALTFAGGTTTLNVNGQISGAMTINNGAAVSLQLGNGEASQVTGNGFNTVFYAKSFGESASITNNGTILVNGYTAEIVSGGFQTHETYYVQDATQTFSLSGAKNVVFDSAETGTATLTENATLTRVTMNSGKVAINANKTLQTGYLTNTSTAVSGPGMLKIDGNTTGNNDNTDVDLSLITSALTLRQVKGTLEAASLGNITADITLQNYNWAGAEWNDVKGDSYTFTGAITCNVTNGGGLVFNGSGTKNAVSVTFTGDLSGWANSASDNYRGLRSTGGMALDVTISGTPTNSAIANSFLADKVSRVSSSGTMNVTVARDATIAGRVKINKLTIADNKIVSLTNSAADTIKIEDAIVLNNGSKLTIAVTAPTTQVPTPDTSKTTQSLTLGSGATLTLGTAESHNNNLTTTTLTVNGSSTLNANLVIANGGTLDFSSGAILTMGCDVTISGSEVTVVIDSSELASIQQGHELTLITGIEHLNLNDAITVHFKGQNDQSLDGYGLRLEQGKDGISLVVTPEPATATLSLLALAALAARRRRH